MIASRLIQTKVTGLGATRSARTGVQSRMYSRQVLRQQIVTLAAAESEVEEEPAAEAPAAEAPAAEAPAAEAPAAEAKPRRAGGKGPRKPKPGPAQTMKVDELNVGQEYNGAVVSVTDFGAFVNVGCDVDGLLHISQISNEFVKNVADAVSIGQEVSVRVLSVDLEKKKFSLTAKTGEAASGNAEKPRQARVRKERKAKPQIPVAAGDSITGKIASVASFGVFIDVGNGYQGMLHSSQMKLPEGVEDHFTHFKEGDEIEARVASINREKISLTQLTEQEARNQKEIETKGLATVVDVPEGSGPFAHVLAQAGITRDMFGDSKPAKEAKKTAPKAAPVETPKAEAAKADAGGISAAMVKELRAASGAGMMDCKKALAECNGDIEEAKDFLRKKGLASADKKSGRVAAEGSVCSYIHAGSKLGVLVEVNCETDFVGRGEKFQELVNDMAMQIAACPSVTVVSVEDVSQEMLEKERAIEMEKEDLASKPENIRGQIVQGRLDKIAKEMSLLEQPFVKDTSKTVAEVIKAAIAEIGENIQVRRFERYNLGEGIAKKEEEFAAEEEAPKEEKDTSDAPKVEVSAKLVKELRAASGAGMMDCKKALAENNNDIEAAKG